MVKPSGAVAQPSTAGAKPREVPTPDPVLNAVFLFFSDTTYPHLTLIRIHKVVVCVPIAITVLMFHKRPATIRKYGHAATDSAGEVKVILSHEPIHFHAVTFVIRLLDNDKCHRYSVDLQCC